MFYLQKRFDLTKVALTWVLMRNRVTGAFNPLFCPHPHTSHTSYILNTNTTYKHKIRTYIITHTETHKQNHKCTRWLFNAKKHKHIPETFSLYMTIWPIFLLIFHVDDLWMIILQECGCGWTGSLVIPLGEKWARILHLIVPSIVPSRSRCSSYEGAT